MVSAVEVLSSSLVRHVYCDKTKEPIADTPPNTSHTCCYSPATEHDHPFAGTHCTYPQRDGQAELTWVASYTQR